MIDIAIGVLWFLIGLIILAGIVYLAIWVIESFIHPIPELVKKGIWVVVLLLALIALLSIIVGKGGNIRNPFSRSHIESPTSFLASASPNPGYLHRLQVTLRVS